MKHPGLFNLPANVSVTRGTWGKCLKRLLLVCVAVSSASARTVYDAGKALRQNCASGGYANPYTDENGGVWSYHTSSAVAPFTNLGSLSSHAKIDNNQLDGWGGTSSPHLKVNVTGNTLTSSAFIVDGEPLEVDEMLFHPAANGNTFTVLRFIVPEDGWYSVFASFHDTSKQSPAAATSGASVYVTLGMAPNDTIQASGIVSLENVENSSPRFDFQMPARWLTAGMRLNFAVGHNGANSNDGTGVKVLVVKEDEGTFYDAGIGMKNDVEGPFINPYGNIRDGSWYYLLPVVPGDVDFDTWAPTNFSHVASIFDMQCNRTEGVGFCNNGNNRSPFVVVNTGNSIANGVAPQELCVHPAGSGTGWSTIRFRPPVSGWYSGSVVIRDVSRNTDDQGATGVRVYLNIADHVVTNVYASMEQYSSTARIVFGARLLAAGEPVDIVVSSDGNASSDATAISAIFRRETGNVYDAAQAFAAQWADGSRAHPFSDVLGGGAKWEVGAKTNALVVSQFYSMPASLSLTGSLLNWCVYAAGTSQANGNLPRIALATNGVTSSDSYYLMQDGYYGRKLRITPNELFAHPNSPGYQSSSPTVRAIVPSDGIYRMRGHVRDLSTDINLETPNNADGVRFSIAANGCILATAHVSIDTVRHEGSLAEATLDGSRLWLKAGETIDAVIDPGDNIQNDGTGVSVCYVKEGEAEGRVINVDFCGTGRGLLSPYSGRGREGWCDWTHWTAFRPSASANAVLNRSVEADGVTKRNATIALSRDSGAAIAKPADAGASSMLDSYVMSSDAEDTYTFTISSLKSNEPYSLYLYSAKDNAAGNALFTVGGVTKGVDEPWLLGDTKMVTRFDVTSDVNGVITGTFVAADEKGGAFNGLTLVGDFPEYKPLGFVLIAR